MHVCLCLGKRVRVEEAYPGKRRRTRSGGGRTIGRGTATNMDLPRGRKMDSSALSDGSSWKSR